MAVSRQAIMHGLLLLGIAIATIVVCCLVGGHAWKIGIAHEWQWDYYPPSAPSAERMLGGFVVVFSILMVVSAALVGIRMSATKSVKSPWGDRFGAAIMLAAIIFMALQLQIFLSDLTPRGADQDITATVAPWVGGYWLESLGVHDMRAYLAGYPAYIRDIPVNDVRRGHISDHPPGPIVVHWTVNRAMSIPVLRRAFSPGVLSTDALNQALRNSIGGVTYEELTGIFASAWLWRLLCVLTIIPVYLLGKALSSRETGFAAAAFCALIPALGLFSPYPDQILPLVAVTAFYFFWRAANGGSFWWAMASGFAIFIGMQFTLAIAVVIFMMALAAGLIILKNYAGKSPNALSLRGWLERLGMGLAGFVAPALALKLFLDYDVLAVWRACFEKHAGFAQVFGRTYWKWALFSPVEGALFVGVPIACLIFWRLARQVHGLATLRKSPEWLTQFDVVLWSFVLTVLVLDVSGKSLGEVGRLWMFLMPFGAIVAAEEVTGWARSGVAVGLIAALMGAQLLIFKAALDVFGTKG